MLHREPYWYKNAVIYELHVRAFQDSDGDGLGDFRGLIERLDYLQDLGVTALWLLPFYPSPLKDDGYDIASYTDVHSHYGTLDDFRAFLDEAHRRGLRVITELVLNHTSDQHAWFQRARRAPPGSPERDFYIWGESPTPGEPPQRFGQARIIFQDFEQSNWAWDPIAKAYYWHRFYSHQPDLNYDSPHVQEAVLEVVDFWLEMGVDGLRLDAAPYLFEREGTNCENLPETYAFLKRLRAHVDAQFADRMLLAEANQWPEDAAAYFGEGDACHMAFHFPLMPRMFMAVEMEDRFPILDILAQTPKLPKECQWALFLRNHDELTLEMVTDEERDYMNRVYARDPRARVNLGIRRRLAPLMSNHRRRIELMNGLLFSMPGAPVIYYGDEIGMGDNIYLGDRDGVRTPMQWSPDRNAGFSRANPQSLYLPAIIDPEFHYEAVNVESQRDNPRSLLNWMRRVIDLRKRHPAFGWGEIEFLHPDNPKVLAFLRTYEDETLLVVANLSRFTQPAKLDLSQFAGRRPVELFGKVEFPTIDEAPYPIMLAPHSFNWFCLESSAAAGCRGKSSKQEDQLPVLAGVRAWREVVGRNRQAEFEEALKQYLNRRQFAGRTAVPRSAEIREAIELSDSEDAAFLLLVHVEFYEGLPATYCVPAAFAPDDLADELRKRLPAAPIAQVEGAEPGLLYDATESPRFGRLLGRIVARGETHMGRSGRLEATRSEALQEWTAGDIPAPHTLKVEQANTSLVYAEQFILKLFRRLEEGTNPDLEIGRYLARRGRFAHTPEVAGALEYRRGRSQVTTLAVLHRYIPHESTGWEHALASLREFYEQAHSVPQALGDEIVETSLFDLARQGLPEEVRRRIDGFLADAELLGRRTAELHVALAAGDLGNSPVEPDFQPEPFSALYRRSLYQSLRGRTGRTLRLLRHQRDSLSEALRHDAERLLALEGALLRRFGRLLDLEIAAQRTRIHGDFHLGQALYTGSDFYIIDFEGEPGRPLTTRKLKRPPLEDVVNMIWSFAFAADAALPRAPRGTSASARSDARGSRTGGRPLEAWRAAWQRCVGAAFLESYLEHARRGAFLPRTDGELRALFDALFLEAGLRSLEHHLRRGQEAVRVSLRGLIEALE